MWFLTDLATQSMYQRMDASFVGIIFAVFLTDQSTKAPSVSLFNKKHAMFLIFIKNVIFSTSQTWYLD